MAIENFDGCTGWFDGWPWGGPSWRHCCDIHDWRMFTSDNTLEWIKAGLELGWCVSQIDAIMGVLMLFGVLSIPGFCFFKFGVKKDKHHDNG